MYRVWLWRGLAIVLSFTMMPPSHAFEPVDFESITGWSEDDVADALDPFRRSCEAIVSGAQDFRRAVRFGGESGHWDDVCNAARTVVDARQFFEVNFIPFQVSDRSSPDGLFTGYYEPEVEARLRPEDGFDVPLYAKPPDLVAFDANQQRLAGTAYGRLMDGRPLPYYTREEIEAGALAGKGLEIAWVRDWADAFFLQVQGSGRLHLPDGTTIRLGYAAKNGLPYTSIGARLADRGAIPRDELSMQSIRAWMVENARAARELMWENHSFVFFRKLDLPDPGLGPVGAARVQLTPQRSLAVDRSIWSYGTPVWLDTTVPAEDGSAVAFRRLMIAQDTGTAIRGMARGDVFWGAGANAAFRAGHMKSPGKMVVLLPRRLAMALDLIR